MSTPQKGNPPHMEVVGLIGRILFAAMFLNSGINHIRNREAMAAYARSSGGPAPEVMVPLTGVMIFLGGALILLGVWADLGTLLLVAFLIPVAYYMHPYWKFDDPQMQQTQRAQFWKNISLAGACLVFYYFFSSFDPGLTLGSGLFY